MLAMKACDLGRAPPLQKSFTPNTASQVELFPCDRRGHLFGPERRVVRRWRNGVWWACPLSSPCSPAVRRISRVRRCDSIQNLYAGIGRSRLWLSRLSSTFLQLCIAQCRSSRIDRAQRLLSKHRRSQKSGLMGAAAFSIASWDLPPIAR